MLNIDIKKLPELISYKDKLLLIGSCFTEHIGKALSDLKFEVLQNPNGILFDPESVCKALHTYAGNKKIEEKELFQLNELWNSWQHHSRNSGLDKKSVLQRINSDRENAHIFLKEADWLIITLGSSFSYRLTPDADLASEKPGNGVANCHRAPAGWFEKKLLETEDISFQLEECLKKLKELNPALKFILTISPVRHKRDGLTENNRSKARLIEAVHYIVNKFESAFYFPAYELVIDVLRDYRFYDIDLVHPNYTATEFVLEKFMDNCMDDESKVIAEEIKPVITARNHRAFQPETNAHRQFLISNFEKIKYLQKKYPFLNLKEELVYFSQT